MVRRLLLESAGKNSRSENARVCRSGQTRPRDASRMEAWDEKWRRGRGRRPSRKRGIWGLALRSKEMESCLGQSLQS